MQGGHALLAAAETAGDVVAGRVAAPERLDRSGWRAALVVERTLHGTRAPGETLAIAWEELGSRRPARFVEGTRIVVALEALPPGSLWTGRFPRRDALAVAARGEAFLRDPDATTLDLLGVWLGLPGSERDGAAGVAALARLAATGEVSVAKSALERLDRAPELAERVAGAAAEALATLATDPERSLDLRRAAIELAGRRELRALEPTLVALSATPSPLQGDALDALGRLRGGLAPPRVAELLRAPDPAVRAAAVRRSGSAIEVGTLRSLLRNDPAGEVRAAAAEALADREEAGAAEDLVRALRDEAPPVRLAAMQSLARFGAVGLPALQREIWEAPASDATGPPATAVLTLSLVGPEGLAELRRIAHEHPSHQVRGLAELALGRLPEQH